MLARLLGADSGSLPPELRRFEVRGASHIRGYSGTSNVPKILAPYPHIFCDHGRSLRYFGGPGTLGLHLLRNSNWSLRQLGTSCLQKWPRRPTPWIFCWSLKILHPKKAVAEGPGPPNQGPLIKSDEGLPGYILGSFLGAYLP